MKSLDNSNQPQGVERTQESVVRRESTPAERLQEIESIKLRLLDPRIIAETHDREGMITAESKVTMGNQESENLQINIAGRENFLRDIEAQSKTLEALRSEKTLSLQQKTEEVLVRMKLILGVKDRAAGNIQGEIDSLSADIEKLSSQAEENRSELTRLKKELSSLPDSKKLLEAYYKKMETVPLSKEEKREFLRPEVLSELSTEEYIALWRRLNPQFLTHVTRQGFRDHSAMMYHSAGLGEFHNGLVGVLEDEKLIRPPFAVWGLKGRDEESVRKFIEADVLSAKTEEEAKERLNLKLNVHLASAPLYPDKTAVHFAAQLAASDHYGGEANNEVFFLYPSDVIASQYKFAFNSSSSFTEPTGETKWNDVFVWPSTQENPGVSADAGMVFLPENTLVDPQTGSKYASEIKIVDGQEKRVMVEDRKLISAFTGWAKSLNDESPSMQAYKKFWAERNSGYSAYLVTDFVDTVRQEMLQLGFDEEVAAKIADKIYWGDSFGTYLATGKLSNKEGTVEEVAYLKLKEINANWKKAETPVKAKEYWEKYFDQYPDKRPKHVMFYDGDPSAAIPKFQQKYGIGQADTSAVEGKLLGFDDNHIADMHHDQRCWEGYDDLAATANKIIADYYRS